MLSIISSRKCFFGLKMSVIQGYFNLTVVYPASAWLSPGEIVAEVFSLITDFKEKMEGLLPCRRF